MTRLERIQRRQEEIRRRGGTATIRHVNGVPFLVYTMSESEIAATRILSRRHVVSEVPHA